MKNSRFLTLLTTQLKNQDPLNPGWRMRRSPSQLAQMSTVDGIERPNKMFQSFADGQSAYDRCRLPRSSGAACWWRGRS